MKIYFIYFPPVRTDHLIVSRLVMEETMRSNAKEGIVDQVCREPPPSVRIGK